MATITSDGDASHVIAEFFNGETPTKAFNTMLECAYAKYSFTTIVVATQFNLIRQDIQKNENA